MRSAKMGEKKKKKNRDVREFRHAPAFRIIMIIYSFLIISPRNPIRVPFCLSVFVCVFAPLVPRIKKKKKKKISFFLFRLSQRHSGRKRKRRTKYNGIDRPLGSVKEEFLFVLFFGYIEGGCVCWYIQRWRTWWKTIVFSSFVDTQLSTRRIPNFSI